MLRSLLPLLAVALVGCATPSPLSLDATHPASSSAHATPHAVASDALPEAVAVYAPSGVRPDHAGHAHAAGHDHGSHDGPCCDGETCRMECCEDCAACCEDGSCCENGCDGHAEGMTCEHGDAHEGHADHGAEGCSMGCCEGGECTMGCCTHDGESHGAHDHGAHDHGAHDEGDAAHSCSACAHHGETVGEAVDFTRPATPTVAPTTSLDSDALDLAMTHYLTISAALGNDSMEGVRPAASALAGQLDDDALRAHAEALAAATNVMQAREAFGRLSPGFARLAEGSSHTLTRYVCGMADAPDGGVWLQPEGAEPRNPYFGAAMLACHRDATSL